MKTTINFNDYLKNKYKDGNIETRYDAFAAKKKNIVGIKLAKARKERGLSQRQLTDLLNDYGVKIQKAALSKWEKGDSVPNSYQLFALCIALRIENGFAYFIGDVDLAPITVKKDELTENLNLAGRKLLAKFSEYLVSTGKYAPAAPDTPYIIYREMPVYELGASAGSGQFLDEGHAEMKSFPADSIPEEADYAVRVVGTSMEPVFMDGQYAWVESCDSLENGEVGIFEWNGESYIKVYREQIPDLDYDEDDEEAAERAKYYYDNFVDSQGTLHPEILLISYNTKNGANPPKLIRPNDTFHIFGRVLKA